jgi:glycosyltransferase involved in cell wall biosynthesis
MKACVLIPTYNEENEIAELIHALQRLSLEIIVTDDGSQDKTPLIAESCGAKVLLNERNIGKGAALSRGFDYALKNGFDAVITMDGDGQHRPEDIPVFFKEAESKEADIIVGNRMLNTGNMPFVRVLTNKFMSWMISRIAGQNIPDTQCGFRLIKSGVLEKIKTETVKFEAESEILIKASAAGFRIKSVPIRTVYAQEKSRINPFSDTIRFFKYISKIR